MTKPTRQETDARAIPFDVKKSKLITDHIYTKEKAQQRKLAYLAQLEKRKKEGK